MHGRLAKNTQEIFDFMNLKLTEYATQTQVHNLRYMLGEYTPLESFIEQKAAL